MVAALLPFRLLRLRRTALACKRWPQPLLKNSAVILTRECSLFRCRVTGLEPSSNHTTNERGMAPRRDVTHGCNTASHASPVMESLNTNPCARLLVARIRHLLGINRPLGTIAHPAAHRRAEHKYMATGLIAIAVMLKPRCCVLDAIIDWPTAVNGKRQAQKYKHRFPRLLGVNHSPKHQGWEGN